MIKLFIIIIFLIVIFFILDKYILKKNIQENYLTYFLPYYNKEDVNDLANFYKNNDNNKNFFKKKFNYENIKFGTIDKDKDIIKFLVSSYIANSNIQNMSLLNTNDLYLIIDNINKNNLDFGISSYPVLYNYIVENNNDFTNLRYVTSLYKLYLYFFTKKMYKIYTLNEITPSTIIGISKKNVSYLFYKKLFKDLSYLETDYKIKFYDNDDKLFEGFRNEECQMIILFDVFPNNTIKNFLENDATQDIILLPFKILKEELFLKKNNSFDIDYIDLNYLSETYLPVAFGNENYNQFKPNLKMCFFYRELVTNKNTSKEYVYEFMKFYLKNINYLNNNIPEEGYKLSKIAIKDKLSYFDYHEGSLNFFRDYGYITSIDNQNCKYLVGVKECNEKNLKDNNLYLT